MVIGVVVLKKTGKRSVNINLGSVFGNGIRYLQSVKTDLAKGALRR